MVGTFGFGSGSGTDASTAVLHASTHVSGGTDAITGLAYLTASGSQTFSNAIVLGAGATITTGGLTVSSGNVTLTSGSLTMSGTLSASGLSISGSTTIYGSLGGLTTITTSSSASVGGALVVYAGSSLYGGATLSTGNFTVTAGKIIMNGAAPEIDFSGAASGSGNIRVNGTNGFKFLKSDGTTILSMAAAGDISHSGFISATGYVSGQYLTPTGLTGAVATTRNVGGVASVAPTTGSFNVGDWVVSRSGAIYVCTVAGAPGTWITIGASGSTTVLNKTFLLMGG